MNKALLLLPTALVWLAPAAAAQTQLPVHRAVPPKYAGTYKVATGEFIPAAGARNVDGNANVVIFNNTTPTSYYAFPGNNQEWIDEGILNDRNAAYREQIGCFEVIYCSTDPAASGTIIYTFYNETIECTGPTGGVPGQPNCAYALSGLPMGTPTGGVECWIVTVDLTGGFECPNNTSEHFRSTGAHPANPLFGWGMLPEIDNTGPWLRKGGKGTTNDFVWYDRNSGTNVGCFWFGGAPFASFSMKMWGYQENSIHYYSNRASANTRSTGWGTQPLDTLFLYNPTWVKKCSFGTWRIGNPTAGRSYLLIYSFSPTTFCATGAGGQTFTFLVPPITAQSIPFPGGSLTASVPCTLPPTVYVQALEFQGAPILANVTACSNGLAHYF